MRYIILFILLGFFCSCSADIDQDKLLRDNPFDPDAAYISETNALISSAADALLNINQNEITFQWNIDDSTHFSHYKVFRRDDRNSTSWEEAAVIYDRTLHSYR
ncbi:MAG TPA: hypothetical protein VKS21_10890 [Spirochaetota bacterium]|nr:hypothetical protein [Spirochaetota bacterium]